MLRNGADPDGIVGALEHYMGDDVFTYPQLRQNLREKLPSGEFSADLETLATDVLADYEVTTAAGLVMELLGSRLRNAPPEQRSPTASGADSRHVADRERDPGAKK